MTGKKKVVSMYKIQRQMQLEAGEEAGDKKKMISLHSSAKAPVSATELTCCAPTRGKAANARFVTGE